MLNFGSIEVREIAFEAGDVVDGKLPPLSIIFPFGIRQDYMKSEIKEGLIKLFFNGTKAETELDPVNKLERDPITGAYVSLQTILISVKDLSEGGLIANYTINLRLEGHYDEYGNKIEKEESGNTLSTTKDLAGV